MSIQDLLGQYPFLTTTYVAKVIDQIGITPEYMASKWFPIKPIQDYTIQWDVKLGMGGMTQAVAPGSESPMVRGGGFYQRRMTPAFFREKEHVMPHQLQYRRKLGTLNEIENVKTFINEKVVDLKRRVDTRIEYSLWQALFGSYTVNSNRVKFTVDYGVPSRFKPVITDSADKWSAISTADPLTDIMNWIYLFRGTGFKPVEIIYNAYIEKLLLQNSAIRDIKKTIITGGNKDMLTIDNLAYILRTYIGDLTVTKYDGFYNLTTVLTAQAATGASSIVLQDASGISDGDMIRLISYSANGDILYDQFVTVNGTPTGTTVTIDETLEYTFPVDAWVLITKPFLPDNKVIIRAAYPTGVNAAGESMYGNFFSTVSEYGQGNMLNPKPGIFSEIVANEFADPKRIDIIAGVNGLPIRYRNDDFLVATVF